MLPVVAAKERKEAKLSLCVTHCRHFLTLPAIRSCVHPHFANNRAIS